VVEETVTYNTKFVNTNCGIYEILNLNNNHRYIGSSHDLKRRWADHKILLKNSKHHSYKLQEAWDKYGNSAFEFNKLITCHLDLLTFYEQQFIDGLCPEYNIILNPKEYPQEVRDKISKSLMGHPVSKKTRRIMVQAGGNRKGCHLTEETKRKISLANIGKSRCKGRKLSEEHKHRISEASLGKKMSLEACERMRQSHLGVKLSEQHKQRQQEGRIDAKK